MTNLLAWISLSRVTVSFVDETKIELLYAKWSEQFTDDDLKRSVNGTPFYLNKHPDDSAFCDVGVVLASDGEPLVDPELRRRYLSLVMAMWICLHAEPSIMGIINMLSRKSHVVTEKLFSYAKYVLRYLYEMREKNIVGIGEIFLMVRSLSMRRFPEEKEFIIDFISVVTLIPTTQLGRAVTVK